SRLLTGSPVAFGGEGLCASCELACQRRLLLFSPCDLLTEVCELVACAVEDGSGLIAFAFDLSQPVLGHLLQRRPLGHCVLVFTPGLCEFTPGLCEFAAGAHQVPGLPGGAPFGFADRRDVELLGPHLLPDAELSTGRGGVVSTVADRGGVVSAVLGRGRRHETVVSERGTHPTVTCRMRPSPGTGSQRAADG